MIIHKRCTVCHQDIGDNGVEQYKNCGLTVHSECAEFVKSFDCPQCAEELAIGAVEF